MDTYVTTSHHTVARNGSLSEVPRGCVPDLWSGNPMAIGSALGEQPVAYLAAEDLADLGAG